MKKITWQREDVDNKSKEFIYSKALPLCDRKVAREYLELKYWQLEDPEAEAPAEAETPAKNG